MADKEMRVRIIQTSHMWIVKAPGVVEGFGLRRKGSKLGRRRSDLDIHT